MKALFTSLFTTLVFLSSYTIMAQADNTSNTTIHFVGANFQKDAKLEILINNERIGYLTKGVQMNLYLADGGEITILTQGYNMIDAKYGAPIQIKLNVEKGKEYYYSAKWSKTNHLTPFEAEELDKITKNGKKIFSSIDIGPNK